MVRLCLPLDSSLKIVLFSHNLHKKISKLLISNRHKIDLGITLCFFIRHQEEFAIFRPEDVKFKFSTPFPAAEQLFGQTFFGLIG